MRQRTIILALAFFVVSSGSCAAGEWQLPVGDSWHMPDGCTMHGYTIVYMRYCNYGPKGSSVNSGTVFFRICGQEQEPFLVYDYVKKVYTFDPLGNGAYVTSGPFEDSKDLSPDAFYEKLLKWRGRCGDKHDA